MDFVVEGYETIRLLGSGGMARVFLARHLPTGTLRAIKIPKSRGARLSARFRTEGRVQRALRHPNVLEVTDVVDAGGVPALVLEYVAGPTLADLLGAGPALGHQ